MGRDSAIATRQYNNEPLNIGAQTDLGSKFKLGKGVYDLVIEIIFTVVIGTGTGAIAEGLLKAIKSIYLKTSRGEVIIDKVPGLAIYRWAHGQYSTANKIDTLAAASADYKVQLKIPLASLMLRRPEDTILNTMRYKSVDLSIALGTIADLYTTVGTATVTAKTNISFVESLNPLTAEATPVAIPYLKPSIPINPANQQYIDTEKANDLGLMQIMVQAADSATLGVAFSGTPSDTTLASVEGKEDNGYFLTQHTWSSIQGENKCEMGLESFPTGYMFYNFVKNGSIMEARPTGNRTEQRINWVNGTLSTSQVCALFYGARDLAGEMDDNTAK